MTPEAQIRAILRASFAEAAPIIINEIRQEISRTYPPASDPGTPPHLRTGDLALSIYSTVDEFWDGITLTIISDAFYSRFLRDGTKKMSARDYFGQPMIDRMTPILIDIIQKNFDNSQAVLFVQSLAS